MDTLWIAVTSRLKVRDDATTLHDYLSQRIRPDVGADLIPDYRD